MSDDIVKAFQQRLKDLGWYSGEVDGDAGTRTDDAIVRFKGAAGLNFSTPYVGVVTMHALFDDQAPRSQTPAAVSPVPPQEYTWMVKARSFLGLKEIGGPTHNKTIMGWAKDLNVDSVYTSDEISWCGLFVGECIAQTFPTEKLPKNPLGARQWLTFGVSAEPSYGAILVFWRGSKSGWEGHVAFYVGEDKNYYYVLGGNQSNSVSITKVAKDRLLGARVPVSAHFTPRKVNMSISGSASTNEA